MKAILVSLMLLFGLASAPALAGDIGPVIPKASGAPHPEGNTFMRVNHMKLMVHDRDETMRLGDREIAYSLKDCVDCHAVAGDDGQPVSYESDKHFCRTCHDYVAVKVDCFECHNSKPEGSSQAMLTPALPDGTEIAAYLKEAEE
jgi:hypothetical protein